MKAVVQRVKNAGVTVEGKEISRIGKGYMILLGVMDDDTVEDIDILAKKISTLRVFEDENGKMNLDIKSIDGEILAISQFTLCADVKKGNRPSFIRSKEPETARGYYEIFCEKLIEYGVRDVKKGVFGANMKVDLINDGPVTIVYDTEIWVKR